MPEQSINGPMQDLALASPVRETIIRSGHQHEATPRHEEFIKALAEAEQAVARSLERITAAENATARKERECDMLRTTIETQQEEIKILREERDAANFAQRTMYGAMQKMRAQRNLARDRLAVVIDAYQDLQAERSPFATLSRWVAGFFQPSLSKIRSL